MDERKEDLMKIKRVWKTLSVENRAKIMTAYMKKYFGKPKVESLDAPVWDGKLDVKG